MCSKHYVPWYIEQCTHVASFATFFIIAKVVFLIQLYMEIYYSS